VDLDVCRFQNMRRVARELGENLTDEELRVLHCGVDCDVARLSSQGHLVLQAMIDEFDRDQDGAINEQEFMYIMKSASL